MIRNVTISITHGRIKRNTPASINFKLYLSVSKRNEPAGTVFCQKSIYLLVRTLIYCRINVQSLLAKRDEVERVAMKCVERRAGDT